MKLVMNMKDTGLKLKVQYLINAARSGLRLSTPEASMLFEGEAKANAPVRTGNLRDHIHTETVEDAGTRFVQIVTPVTAAANDVGFEPPYARRIERGFIGTDRLGRTYHQAARPYMAPAFETHKDEAARIIKDGVIDSLIDATNQVAERRRR